MNLDRGSHGVRTLMAMGAYPDDPGNQEAFARGNSWNSIADQIRMASVAGATTSSDSSLIGPTGTDLQDLARPLEILGRLPVRAIPFGIALNTTTSGSFANWIGDGKSISLGHPIYSRLVSPFPPLKC